MSKYFLAFILLFTISNSGWSQRRTNTTTDSKSTSTKTTLDKKSKTTPKVDSKTSKKVAETTETKPKEVATEYSKFSTTVELNANPTSSDVSMMNLFGQLTLNFHLSNRFHFGPYFNNKMASSHNYETPVVDARTIELGSFKQYGFGLNFGFNLTPNSVVQIIPELRAGYNIYNMEAVDFGTDNKAFIDHQYISATPRLNIGFKLSDLAQLGVNGGYTMPFYIKGDKNSAYNPQSPVFGVFVRFSLPN